MSTRVGGTKRKVARRDQRRPGDTIGGEGRPIREYIGWDDAEGVFRQDDPALPPQFKARRPTSAKPARARS